MRSPTNNSSSGNLRVQNLRRHKHLVSRLASPLTDIERPALACAPFCLPVRLSNAQKTALADVAADIGIPPGRILGRRIDESRVEILLGWEKLEAFWDTYRHSPKVPITLLDATDEEAIFWAIEFAQHELKASGYPCSHVDYAIAADKARRHFGTDGRPLSVADTARALGIARPTLANRLRLLERLSPNILKVIEQGLIPPEISKILAGVKERNEQIVLAQEYLRRPVSTRTFYRKANPEYHPPTPVRRKKASLAPLQSDAAMLRRRLEERFSAPTSVEVDPAESVALTLRFQFTSQSTLAGIVEKLEALIETDAICAGDLEISARSLDEATRLLHELGVA